MRFTTAIDVPTTPERLFREVSDLTGYPSWLTIVPRAIPHPDDDDTWVIDLRGRLGPLSRSKRLRMVRTVFEPPHHVTFEREETDGREHSAWVLDARVSPGSEPDTAHLEMLLHYGGTLGAGLLERMLRDQVDPSRKRLLARLSESGAR